MLSLILFGVLTHAARAPRCLPDLLGHKMRRVPVADDAEVSRQSDLLKAFARAARKTLKNELRGFAQHRFVRVVEVEPDGRPPDLYPGYGPLRDGAHEAWLTVPGRLVKATAVGPKPTPYAEDVMKFCAEQELRAELFHWRRKTDFDGVAYGQWYRVTTRVTTPTVPAELYGRARPEFAGTMRRREPDERQFSLNKGQPATYLRISW